jgi:hypothetical protein
MEQLLGTGMPLAEAEIMFNGGTPSTYDGNQISYTDDRNQTAETMPSGPAGIASPSGLRPITGGIMDPIMGGSQEQPIDPESLTAEQINALGEGFIGQYIRRPDGSVRSVRDIGDPTGDIGAPAQTGQSGIRYYDSNEDAERIGAFSQALTEQVPLARDYVAGVTGAITGEGYSATQDLLDEAAAEQRMFNPELRRAGGLTGFGAGMVLTPGAGYIGRGASGAQRALRAGQVGAGAGFVYGGGTGRGDAQERLSRALLTGAAGGGGGVAGQRVADVLAPQAARLGEQIRPVLSGAQRRVSDTVNRTLGRENTDLAAVLEGATGGVAPYEVSPGLSTLAELLYQSPGPGQQIIRDSVGGRVAGMPERVRGSIQESLGGNRGYFAELDRLQDVRRSAAREGMAEIGATPVPMSPEAIRAIRSDLSTPAIRAAAQEAMADISPQAGESANRLFGLVEQAIDDPAAVRLTVQEAQDISYALREAATRAYRGGFNSRGESLQAMSRAIRQSATDGVPEYSAWLQRYGDDSSNIEALELGRNILSNSMDMTAEGVQRQIADMPGPAMEYFRRGVGEAILTRAERAGDVRAMRDLIRVPGGDVGNRVRLAFPDEQSFDDFMRMAGRESDLADTANRITGGSPTYRRGAAAEDMEAGGIPGQLLEVGSDVADLRFGSAVRRAGVMGARALDSASRRQRGVLTNEESNRLLAEVLNDPERLRDLMSRAAARQEIPGFSRQASAQIADVLSRRAGPLAGQATDPFASPDRRRASQ